MYIVLKPIPCPTHGPDPSGDFLHLSFIYSPITLNLLYLGLALSTMGEADSDPVKLCKASLTLC